MLVQVEPTSTGILLPLHSGEGPLAWWSHEHHVVISYFRGAYFDPPSSTSSSADAVQQVAPAVSNAEAVKSIKQRIAALETARAAFVSVAGCSADRDRVDQELASARASLATFLPNEVAVNGTLSTAPQARAAVTRAEGKVAKLESQLATLVEQHESAAAELAACRTKLLEAEAATAKAASVALPAEHLLSAGSSDPGPFWEAIKAVISQRCPGMAQGLLANSIRPPVRSRRLLLRCSLARRPWAGWLRRNSH